MENLLDSSSENNVSAGAFERSVTVKFQRNVAFPKEIIAFMLSEATVTSVASREGKGSRASSFEVHSVTKTLAGKTFLLFDFRTLSKTLRF